MIYMYIDTKAMIILVCGIMFPKDCIPNMEMNSDYIKNVLNGFFFLLPLPTFFIFFQQNLYILQLFSVYQWVCWMHVCPLMC